jgi:GNAT superfamily N-acetyltransferase
VLHSNADAVPVAIRGTFDAWPKQRLLPRFKRVSVTFGQPLRFREHDSDGRAAVRISEHIETSVRALLSLEPDTPADATTLNGPRETAMANRNNEWTETLKDGRRVLIRPIRRDDVDRNARFLDELSPPSRHFLFLGGISRLSDEALRRLCDPDYVHDMAYVALALDGRGGEPQRQVAVCRYAGTDSAQGAEISVAVADEWQHQGLGKRILTHLIDYARSRGVTRLYSMDALGNQRMRKLAVDVGFTERPDPDDSSQIIFHLDLGAANLSGGAAPPRTGKRSGERV